MGGKHRSALTERFWRKVQKSEHGCWEWTGARMSQGWPYGNFNAEGKYIQAHRFSYVLHFGQINEEIRICHRCDNPACVRPDHLFAGTAKDNSQDMLQKGRNRFTPHPGEKNGFHKLTEIEVRAIRAVTKNCRSGYKAIGAMFNVSESSVGLIARGKSWKHLK